LHKNALESAIFGRNPAPHTSSPLVHQSLNETMGAVHAHSDNLGCVSDIVLMRVG